MNKYLITSIAFKLAFSFIVIMSCSKDPFPSTINADFGRNVIFDATEEQIIRVDADSFKIELEIVSIENTLCPEGSRCVFMGNAIIGFRLINEFHELLTLSYPTNDIIRDSSQFIFNSKEYYVKLLSAKKVYYNKRETKTKTVVELRIESI